MSSENYRRACYDVAVTIAFIYGSEVRGVLRQQALPCLDWVSDAWFAYLFQTPSPAGLLSHYIMHLHHRHDTVAFVYHCS